jgi:hypothetical protein
MMNEPNSKFDNPRRESDHSAYDEERWAAANRRGNVLTGICIVLAAAIVGLAWFAYPMLKEHDASLHNLPGLTQSVDTIGDRLKEAEAKAADSSSAQGSLRDQMTDLGRSLRARIESVSKQASQSAEDAYYKLQAKIETEVQAQAERLANVNERVSGLESSRDADQVQIAQLKQDLNQVRDQGEQRAAQLSDELAQVRRQVEQGHASDNDQIVALKHDQDRDRRNISAVSDQIAVRKIPFEANKDHNREVAEGITLHIDNTNIEYRRVSGWMWVASDHRNIWLRNQSALEPVIFYGSQDGQKRELVITNVTKNSVTGYLLLPKQANQTAALAETGPAGQ